MSRYYPQKVEKRWQKIWAKEEISLARDISPKSKKYVLIEFPYPSGEGLHMGHLRPYVAGDVYSRYFRMKGFEVMYPIGWDAFGLPAENFAIKKGIHPAITTERNIKNAKKQVNNWGISFDWSREIDTTDPNYYRWTQWIFLRLFKAGLAYQATGLINWCPKCLTGLANEEVIEGKCERCNTTVVKKEMRQWYLRITAYAEKLLKGLRNLNWPEAIKIQQENWIGRSEGALIEFKIPDSGLRIEVFTTRPDTIFGATYLILAPEHELISNIKNQISNIAEVEKYIEESKKKTDIQRTAEGKEKTGVELKGVKVINPANQKEISVWIADYVLAGYGTGAIMAVPAHDERDAEFAKKFNLPFSDAALVDPEEAVKKVSGGKVVQYKLRDWVFSRQRYWGEPIPIIHCVQCGVVPVPEKDLPVKLPKIKKYQPTGTGESPLAAVGKWVKVKCPNCRGEGRRETNTMPQWAGSSWYYLRYTDPQNKKQFADPVKMKHWLPVDEYFGGLEHTTLHLLYSRFWHLFLYDQGLVPIAEPYTRRIPHGIVLAEDGEKMSKSRGNVVNPDEVVKEYGADTLRMHELFLGPHEETVSWNSQGIVGIKRFIDRVWLLAQKDPREHSEETERVLQETIKKVGGDIEGIKFNTAVSALMIAANKIYDHGASEEQLEKFLKILAPFAPHLAEEIWRKVLGHKKSIYLEEWPAFEARYLQKAEVSLVVQINGRTREVLKVKRDLSEEEVKRIVLSSGKLQKYLAGQTIKKVIYLPNRLINFII